MCIRFDFDLHAYLKYVMNKGKTLRLCHLYQKNFILKSGNHRARNFAKTVIVMSMLN